MSKSSPKTPVAPAVKPMRLTTATRDAFVASVMADVPKTDYEQMIRDAVMKQHAATVPAAVKKILADQSTAGWVNEISITLSRSHGLPRDAFVSFTLPAPSDKWLRDMAAIEAAKYGPAWCQQEDTHAGLRSTLRIAADRCTTTTQLAEAFPEFAKYLAKSEADATRNLPAIANLVTEFTKAGWPKGKKAEA